MSEAFPEEEAARPEPVFKLPGVIVLLLAVMFAVQAIIAWGDERAALWIFQTFGFTPSAYAHGAPVTIEGWARLIWPFLTHGFVHGNWLHLALNAAWLMAVGTPLARRLGTAPFLAFYFLCGAASVGLHWALYAGSPATVVGASGAVSGCMAGALRVIFGGSARYFLNKHPGIGTLAPIWDRRLVLVTVIFVAVNLITGLGIIPIPGTDGAQIAWAAHLGGYLAGLILIPPFDRAAGGGRRAYPTLSAKERP